jgi:hypothetical protein
MGIIAKDVTEAIAGITTIMKHNLGDDLIELRVLEAKRMMPDVNYLMVNDEDLLEHSPTMYQKRKEK